MNFIQKNLSTNIRILVCLYVNQSIDLRAFVSKICKGEPKSVMAVLALIDYELYQLLTVNNLKYVKKLKPYFKSLSPTLDLLNQYLHPSFSIHGTKIHALNLRLMDFNIKSFVQLILDNAIPPDVHLIPQSTLKNINCAHTQTFSDCATLNNLQTGTVGQLGILFVFHTIQRSQITDYNLRK